MIGFPRQLADRFALRRRNHLRIHHILIGVKRGVLTVRFQIDLEQQREELQRWLREWRQHPAHDNLPNDLRLLQSLIDQQPQKIALLLPMQGKLAEASEAVSDGFFAAYYQALANGRHTPEVRQYDSTNGVIAAYQ